MPQKVLEITFSDCMPMRASALDQVKLVIGSGAEICMVVAAACSPRAQLQSLGAAIRAECKQQRDEIKIIIIIIIVVSIVWRAPLAQRAAPTETIHRERARPARGLSIITERYGDLCPHAT